jgi:hypothetical protein
MDIDAFIVKGYKLIILNKDPGFDKKVKQRLVDVFFTVYPELVKTHNPGSLKKVLFIIDPEYSGVAATGDGATVFNPAWLRAHPGDVDVVTHEVMHIVQAYPDDSGPGWITEGIADYVRYKFGVDNTGGGWSLPPYRPRQHYTDSYRVMARFLTWLEKHTRSSIVADLDSCMRNKTYTPDTWKKLTGKTVDEWWQAYSKNPVI